MPTRCASAVARSGKRDEERAARRTRPSRARATRRFFPRSVTQSKTSNAEDEGEQGDGGEGHVSGSPNRYWSARSCDDVDRAERSSGPSRASRRCSGPRRAPRRRRAPPARETRCLISVACAMRFWRIAMRSSARAAEGAEAVVRVGEAEAGDRPLEEARAAQHQPARAAGRSDVAEEAVAERDVGAVFDRARERERVRRAVLAVGVHRHVRVERRRRGARAGARSRARRPGRG